MADILHDFPIFAPPQQVFEAITSPAGLATWWTTENTAGDPVPGTTYELGFGPSYHWQADVRKSVPASEIEWEFTEADEEWRGTRVGFRLVPGADRTQVHFYHTGWPEATTSYRNSSFCWAMYLRLLKRYVEHGEVVPYNQRLAV
ncbi:MAG TPA: SRPBCC domain-containing protein [Rhodothermales bacterium]|nr:SRPBCC domain-containing protein [Rhodothermales bacterium]